MGTLSEEVRTEVLCGRICDLEAENAKLRETLQRRSEQFEGMTEMWVERGVENHKLRELVRDMWGFIEGTDEDCGDVTFSSCFDYCKHDTANDGCCKTGECWYEQRMRELGVTS